ncbi:Serine/threonine-protein kinase PknH [Posidoniimonas polymericola]|uniref:Serine/threonine-protein kinase PknH n=1 Tax=Posidoniimonas polymericola TaxID=2528002 RepID=A0A5C5ZFJ7_9BACT|nr:serine/threonine-protein kinase [Posidoniimonas polymericola]TWT85333.1 Serine/threonine-protein kinase PknH [Posidoniimonas polymericola]
MANRHLRFLPTKATFNLGEKLGAGTVGVVYRATSPDIEHPVAVKILHPSVADDQNIVDRFEREIMITERMEHPHIVKHYGGGQLDGQFFYAMQLLEHGSLKDRIKTHGPVPWPQAAAYAVHIASALQHAHNHGIIHRDLKPSNLFFDEGGDLVLGDFGIARDTYDADITEQGITVGTYAYMSPEQITADSKISGKADLYSLGCVLYEMLTGAPPYTGANFAQIWDQHLNKNPPRVRDFKTPKGKRVDCPEWLDDLITQLLAKEASDRPHSARAVQGMIMQHLFDEFGEEKARELTKDQPMGSDESEQQPRMWAVWAALALIAAVLAIVAAKQG